MALSFATIRFFAVIRHTVKVPLLWRCPSQAGLAWLGPPRRLLALLLSEGIERRPFFHLLAYGVNTKPISASASYWLWRPQPLVILAATYTSAAKPAVGHGPSSSPTVAVIGVLAGTGAPLGSTGGGPTGVTPRTSANE